MQLANDSGSTEAEAKVAMRRATRMMKELNITQADLIAHETDAERSARAGHSTVTISSTLGKMVRCQQWHETACDAVFEAFDVQYYSENHDEGVDWVFYGLAEVGSLNRPNSLISNWHSFATEYGSGCSFLRDAAQPDRNLGSNEKERT